MNLKRLFSLSMAVLLFMVLPALEIAAQHDSGWRASSQTVEKMSSSRPQLNFTEEKVPEYTLPDLLTTLDGEKVNSVRSWNRMRRPEILELYRTHVFGRDPETTYQKSFKVVKVDKHAMNGMATLKEVDVSITRAAQSLVIRLVLFTPNNAKGPVPTFLLINNRGKENTDPSRTEKSQFWPAEEVIARGYGIAAFHNADVDQDKFDEFKGGIHALLDKTPRPDDAWGTIAAWAWGASRCLDYLVTDPDVEGDKVAVLGHSRGGKTALWAGAQDSRFAMTISNESGCTGAALARRRFGETVAVINRAFPHWFCTNYKKYNDREEDLPVDSHMLIALTAPRPVYVASAGEDIWADPRGSYLALHHAAKVYRLFKSPSDLPEAMPPVNEQVISGKVGYHVREGGHNMLLEDWQRFMNFADKVWK
ncbi:MAG: acetylxylan esterase [Chryseosolibacter sp.]